MASKYSALAEQLMGSIRLGYESEAEDPGFTYELPSDGEIAWLAHWLVSEGWVRDPAWPHVE